VIDLDTCVVFLTQKNLEEADASVASMIVAALLDVRTERVMGFTENYNQGWY
jgi:hypothetical protein